MSYGYTTHQPGKRLPTLPGYTHGIIANNPLTVQCDDCHTCYTATTKSTIFAIKQATFNHHVPGVRACNTCWEKRGWKEN